MSTEPTGETGGEQGVGQARRAAPDGNVAHPAGDRRDQRAGERTAARRQDSDHVQRARRLQGKRKFH